MLLEIATIVALLFSATTVLISLGTRAAVAELDAKILKYLQEKYVTQKECERLHKLLDAELREIPR